MDFSLHHTETVVKSKIEIGLNPASDEKTDYMEKAKELLGKAIPIWIRYAELNPEQAWMVIHLLKDGLFALDRYSEIENILKQILKNDSDNICSFAV